jgi:hypothetical protein
MRLRLGSFFLAAAVLTPVAWGQTIEVGTYLCTVEKRTGVSMTHLEGSPPPEVFVDALGKVKFRLKVERGPGYVVTELPYDGPDASRMTWHTENAILHSPYLGDGWQFAAQDDQAFLRMHKSLEPNAVWFWHSGFEYAGGEDTHLTVRWGRCFLETGKAS